MWLSVITVVQICCGLTRRSLVSPQHFDHCDDACSLSIRVQTTLNHIRFVFYPNIKDIERNLCQDLLTIEKTSWTTNSTSSATVKACWLNKFKSSLQLDVLAAYWNNLKHPKKLTCPSITAMPSIAVIRSRQLVNKMWTTVLYSDIFIPITTVVVPVITDSTSDHTFGDCRVCARKPNWFVSAAVFHGNTFVRHPIPGSSLETVPTWYQVPIASIVAGVDHCVSLGAVCFAQDCVIFTSIHCK